MLHDLIFTNKIRIIDCKPTDSRQMIIQQTLDNPD
jgi:hypothetical protein